MQTLVITIVMEPGGQFALVTVYTIWESVDYIVIDAKRKKP